jgi:hypothetical protein
MGKDYPKIEQMRAARLRQERDYLESLSEPSLTKIKRLASLSGESYEEVVERKATQRKTADLEADGYSPSEAAASAELWAVQAAEDKAAQLAAKLNKARKAAERKERFAPLSNFMDFIVTALAIAFMVWFLSAVAADLFDGEGGGRGPSGGDMDFTPGFPGTGG